MTEYDPEGKFKEPYYANVIRRLTTTLGLYFFNKKNTLKLREQMKELKKMINTEPYASAISCGGGVQQT